MIMNAERSSEYQAPGGGEADQAEEYAVLYSDPSLATYPDLVTGRSQNEAAILAAGQRHAGTCPGLEYAVMSRRPGGTWLEVATGRTPRQVLADRWHIRIDAGGW